MSTEVIAPAESIFAAREVRERTMSLAFEMWLKTDTADRLNADANYRNALLGMLAVTELTTEKPGPTLLNETFTAAALTAAEQVHRPLPVPLPRRWSETQWRRERRALWVSLETTSNCPDLRTVRMDNYQVYWAISRGWLRHAPKRDLLI